MHKISYCHEYWAGVLDVDQSCRISVSLFGFSDSDSRSGVNMRDLEYDEVGNVDQVLAAKEVKRVTYKIEDVPPWYMCLFLGFQHFLTMIGGVLSIPFILCPALCMRYFSK